MVSRFASGLPLKPTAELFGASGGLLRRVHEGAVLCRETTYHILHSKHYCSFGKMITLHVQRGIMQLLCVISDAAYICKGRLQQTSGSMKGLFSMKCRFGEACQKLQKQWACDCSCLWGSLQPTRNSRTVRRMYVDVMLLQYF